MAARVEGVAADRIRWLLTVPGVLEDIANLFDDASEGLAGLFEQVEANKAMATELGPELWRVDDGNHFT